MYEIMNTDFMGGFVMTVKIGDAVREHRLRMGVTQEELAEALGVSSQAVSRWETAACCPDTETLPLLARCFGITIDELFGFQGDREEEIDRRKDDRNQVKVRRLRTDSGAVAADQYYRGDHPIQIMTPPGSVRIGGVACYLTRICFAVTLVRRPVKFLICFRFSPASPIQGILHLRIRRCRWRASRPALSPPHSHQT